MFKAILIPRGGDEYRAELAEIDESQLPDAEVKIKVHYSSLNYKDGLAISGNSPVVRQFPMVVGIDFAGIVEESRHPSYEKGMEVILNGWGVGEKHWGGLAQLASVPAQWLVPLPKGLTLKQSMIIGTAGYTAMLAVLALEHHGIKPNDGSVLVTGATGGVGSFAVAILAKLGYSVTASTGHGDPHYLIEQLGAHEIIDRTTLEKPGKPLTKERWLAAIDCVGSHTLANVCAATQYGGVVAACGLAQGIDFPTTVAPFILRGITLAGIDSVMRPYADRIEAWGRLAELMNDKLLTQIATEISLAEVIPIIPALLKGEIQGRILVNVQK